MSLFCWTQRKIFWRKFVTRLFWGTIDLHSRKKNTMEVNGAPELLCFPHSSKYLPLCSAEHKGMCSAEIQTLGSNVVFGHSAHCFTYIIFSFYSCRKIMKHQQTLKQTVYSCFSVAAEIWQKLLGGTCLLFFILLLLVEKLEIILYKNKEWHRFLCSLFLFNFINENVFFN